MYLSFVLAAYNEEKNVRKLTLQILAAMKRVGLPFEIIYVIDGDDGTYPVLCRFKKEKGIKNLK